MQGIEAQRCRRISASSVHSTGVVKYRYLEAVVVVVGTYSGYIVVVEEVVHWNSIAVMLCKTHQWQHIIFREAGVGFATSPPGNPQFDCNRTELLKLLLTCFSEAMYLPPTGWFFWWLFLKSPSINLMVKSLSVNLSPSWSDSGRDSEIFNRRGLKGTILVSF